MQTHLTIRLARLRVLIGLCLMSTVVMLGTSESVFAQRGGFGPGDGGYGGGEYGSERGGRGERGSRGGSRGGGFSPEMIMQRLDLDGDGRISPEEISQSRMPIAQMAEQAGVKTKKGLKEKDVRKIFEKMQSLREQGGGSRSRKSSKSSGPAEPPPRVTIDLQAAYVPGDANSDGQVTMAEWLKWKGRAALAEFLSLDRNADGFLTPRELAKAADATPVDLATYFPMADPAALVTATGSPAPVAAGSNDTPMAATTPATSAKTPETTIASTSNAKSVSKVEGSVTDADKQRHAETAARQFKLLDRNRDGSVTELEWRRSFRLRPKFEALGIDLTQPMSADQFTTHYVKIATSGSAS